MARTFSLSLVVALLLIFAITEASRGQTNQTDGQKTHSRGTTRYNSRSTTESSNLSTSERSPRDKSSRSDAVPNLEKPETHIAREGSFRSRSKSKQTADLSVTTSRTSSKHLNTSADNSRNRQKSHATQAPKEEIMRDTHDNNKENRPESQTQKRLTASRRMSSDASPVWMDSAKLDDEVFMKSPDFMRSRTGRKIYPNPTNHGRESKSEVIPTRKPPENENVEKVEGPSSESEKEEVQSEHLRLEDVTSKANVSRKIDAKSTNSSSIRKDEAKDVLLSGSESVRVDVPLTVGNEDVNFLTSATVSSLNVPPRQASRPVKEKVESNDIARSSSKKSRHPDRSKSRNRSKTRDPNLEGANSGTSRRGSSKSGGTAETNGRSSNSRHRSNAKNVNSRGRSAHRSRDAVTAEARSSGRQRNAESVDSETNANRRTETRRNDRRTSEGKRRSKDGRSKAVEPKVDEQDIRAQSRSRSRAAISNLEVTTAYIPKATIAETTTVPSVDIEITTSNTATIRPSTTARTSSSTERASRNKGRDRGESSRAKKPPKEDFFNHGLGFRGRKTSTEGPSAIVADPQTTSKSETQLRGNPGWTLRRRPGHVNHDASSSTTSTSVNRDQTNEIVLLNDVPKTTETPLSNSVKTGRRGTKRPKAKDESNTVSGVAAKSTTRGSKTFNKSENFGLPKGVERESESDNYPPAFRARLSQLKNSNSKPTGGKSTARTSLQATKPSSLASLFSERSKMKLELARRLIKPELNVDENDFDVTTAAYSDKSKAKEVSTASESRNVEKTTKATSKLIGARATHGSSTIASAPKEKSTVRGRWKLLETRKLPKDRNVEAPLRSLTTKKSRVTSERAVIPPSVEEMSTRSVTELNAIPRRYTTIAVSHRDAVEGTATTTVDTTKVRSRTSTTGSQEETSTLANSVEENSIITTIEPLKLDKTFIETITVASIKDALAESKAHPTEFPQEVTLSPAVTTSSGILSSSTPSTTKSEKLYPVYIPDSKEYNLLDDSEKTTIPSDTSKSSVRARYTIQQEQPDKVAVSMVTSRTVGPTSRYIRKKSGVFTPYDAAPKTSSTEAAITQTKRREFRPRTSTYRRHSEVLTSQVTVRQSATVEQTTAGVPITPKPTKFAPQVVTPSPRSSSSEPFVSVRIDTSNDTTTRTSGIAESSNGNSGNSNVFNPTRSTYLTTSNTTTLLEQLRSTVAPLLNNLGDKTPIFSGAYSNVNTANSARRITPNGSPPRFSARYKGAELFVRKPSVGQAVVPSLTTSSTTASTPIEVFPTKVPEDSEAVAPPWTSSIVSTPSCDLVLNHIDANSLR